MFRRRAGCVVGLVSTAVALPVQQVRGLRVPGWQNTVKNKKTRDKEARDQERKERQLEKLPDTTLLPDHPYPTDKQVLSDQMFQAPVYENHLDTPALFDGSSFGASFIQKFDISMFERSQYPEVPEVDHRAFMPGSDEFAAHSRRALKYAVKHGVAPDFVPHKLNSVNLSVVFQEVTDRRSPVQGQGDTPPQELTRRNFWLSSHCGNYIELCHTAKGSGPSFFLNVPEDKKDTYYTIVMASPDYPFRTRPHSGFYFHTVVANVKGRTVGDESTVVGKPVKGDVVLPYNHPLPNEGAGCSRTICMVFEQSNGGKKIDGLKPYVTQDEINEVFPFVMRANYRFHDNRTPEAFSALRAVEKSIEPSPVGTSFFQTNWDIQVQEFYEALPGEILEPNYIPEGIEDLLKFNARPSDADWVKSRRLEDGSMNEYHEWGEGRVNKRLADDGFIGQRYQYGENRAAKGQTMQRGTTFSRKTTGISKDGKYYQLPNDSYYGYTPMKTTGRQY